MNHLVGLLGITALCIGWGIFQIWLRKKQPSQQGFKPGCGACQSTSCEQKKV